MNRDELLAARDHLRPVPVGEQTTVPDAHKAIGQNMQRESPQELIRRQRHLALLVSMRIIFLAKADLPAVKADQAVVADSDAMCVAG